MFSLLWAYPEMQPGIQYKPNAHSIPGTMECCLPQAPPMAPLLQAEAQMATLWHPDVWSDTAGSCPLGFPLSKAGGLDPQQDSR